MLQSLRSALVLKRMESSKLTIRRIQPAHVTHEVTSAVSNLLSQLRSKASSIDPDALRRVAAENYLILAVGPSGQIVGMACLVVMHLPQGVRTLIESVVVDENSRGLGVGAALIADLVREARLQGSEHVSLTCNDARPEARRFYQDVGFNEAPTSVMRRLTDTVPDL